MNDVEDLMLEFLEQDQYLMSVVQIMKGLNPGINSGLTYQILFGFMQDGMPTDYLDEVISDIKDTMYVEDEDRRH